MASYFNLCAGPVERMSVTPRKDACVAIFMRSAVAATALEHLEGSIWPPRNNTALRVCCVALGEARRYVNTGGELPQPMAVPRQGARGDGVAAAAATAAAASPSSAAALPPPPPGGARERRLEPAGARAPRPTAGPSGAVFSTANGAPGMRGAVGRAPGGRGAGPGPSGNAFVASAAGTGYRFVEPPSPTTAVRGGLAAGGPGRGGGRGYFQAGRGGGGLPGMAHIGSAPRGNGPRGGQLDPNPGSLIFPGDGRPPVLVRRGKHFS